MRTQGSRLLAVFGILTALGVSAAVIAAPKDEKKGEKKSAQSISAYDQLILDGHKAFAASIAGGVMDDAINAYRKAITNDPNRPEGHLYLGGALFQKADYAGSEEALTNAANRARANKAYTNFLGKALFLTATVKEAQQKPEEAKAAWQAYSTFAKENPDQEFPKGSGDAPPMLVKTYAGSAVDRETKIENYAKLTTDYAKVKELILKRQKELGIDPTPKPVPK